MPPKNCENCRYYQRFSIGIRGGEVLVSECSALNRQIAMTKEPGTPSLEDKCHLFRRRTKEPAPVEVPLRNGVTGRECRG